MSIKMYICTYIVYAAPQHLHLNIYCIYHHPLYPTDAHTQDVQRLCRRRCSNTLAYSVEHSLPHIIGHSSAKLLGETLEKVSIHTYMHITCPSRCIYRCTITPVGPQKAPRQTEHNCLVITRGGHSRHSACQADAPDPRGPCPSAKCGRVP